MPRTMASADSSRKRRRVAHTRMVSSSHSRSTNRVQGDGAGPILLLHRRKCFSFAALLLLILSCAVLAAFPLTGEAAPSEASTVGPETSSGIKPELSAKVATFFQWVEKRFGIVMGTERYPLKWVWMSAPNGTQGEDTERPEIAILADRRISKGDVVLYFPKEMLIRADKLPSPFKEPLASKREGLEKGKESDESGYSIWEKTDEEQAAAREGGGADGDEGGAEGERGVGEGEEGEGLRQARRGGSSSIFGEDGDEEFWAPFTTLGAWLLRERSQGPESDWAPFIDILPPVTVPIASTFSDGLLRLFEYEGLERNAKEISEALKKQYTMCNPSMIANATLDEFLWAMSIVISRNFAGTRGTEKDRELFDGQPHLLPLADLINHANSDRTGVRHRRLVKADGSLDMSGALEFYAVRDITEGEEVFFTYHWSSNEELLLGYGFVMPGNENDHFELFPTVAELMPAFEKYVLRVPLPEGEEVALEALDAAIAGHRAAEMQIRRRQMGGDSATKGLFGERAEFHEKSTTNKVWPHGHVDPRLISSLAVMSYQFGHFGAPEGEDDEQPDGDVNLDALVDASVEYGFGWTDTECGSLVKHAGEGHEKAMRMAGQAILFAVQDAVEAFSTTLEEDEAALQALEGDTLPSAAAPVTTCSSVEGSGGLGEGRQCNSGLEAKVGKDGEGVDDGARAIEQVSGGGDSGEEISEADSQTRPGVVWPDGITFRDKVSVLQFRIGKKRLLRDVIDRLGRTCRLL